MILFTPIFKYGVWKVQDPSIKLIYVLNPLFAQLNQTIKEIKPWHLFKGTTLVFDSIDNIRRQKNTFGNSVKQCYNATRTHSVIRTATQCKVITWSFVCVTGSMHILYMLLCLFLVTYKKKVLNRLKSALQIKCKKIRKVLSLYTVNNGRIINYMHRISLLLQNV